MAIGIKNRYYCNNISKCKYAYRDHVFSEKDYIKNKGICSGKDEDGCGTALKVGEPLNNRRSVSILLFIMLGVFFGTGWFLFPILFPKPITGIAFSTNATYIEENGHIVEIEVIRKGNNLSNQIITFETVEGKATPEEDYEPERGELVFQANEQNKTITITILQDNNYQEGEENFSVVLTNVHPPIKHPIFIKEAAPDSDSLEKAEAIVRSLSIIANDIASYYVKGKHVRLILKGQQIEDMELAAQYLDTLETIENNIKLARERYIQLFKDLERIERSSIFRTIDNWIASLDRRDYLQQKKATVIMKKQFESYLTHGIIEMDLWAKELSDAIPHAKTNKNPIRHL